MTNGPDDKPGQEPTPPPPPPQRRGLFARQDPDQPSPPPAPREPRPENDAPVEPDQRQPRAGGLFGRHDEGQEEFERLQEARNRDPRSTPPLQPDDNPFLLPNERDRMPVYGATPLPVVPLALMALAVVVGIVLFVMSRSDSNSSSSGIPANSGLILHLEGVDMTEDAFRREIAAGIKNGRIPCNQLAALPADNLAVALKQGALRMEVPNTSGVAQKNGQKADDASVMVAAKVILESCPKQAAPAQTAPQQQTQPQQNPPGQNPPGQQVPGGTQQVPGNQPAPATTLQPVPGTNNPTPVGTLRPVPGTTPRP